MISNASAAPSSYSKGISLIELRRLRAFVTLAEEGHVTRAAERLGMQQPPLTRLLRGLETELGVRLMDRHPRGVRPTEAGRVLLDQARGVLARAQGIEADVRRAGRGEVGHLAIGMTHSVALHPLVPKVLRQFRMELPGISLELDEAGTDDLLAGLVDERIDAAFLRLAPGSLAELLTDPVLDEEMLVALPAGHPLAATDLPLRLTALAEEPFILFRRPTGAVLNDTVLAACHLAGFSPRIAYEPPRLAAALTLVAAGLGISVVPASLHRLGIEDVVFRAIDGERRLLAPICLGTKRTARSPALTRFRQLVQRIRDPSPGA